MESRSNSNYAQLPPVNQQKKTHAILQHLDQVISENQALEAQNDNIMTTIARRENAAG